MAGNGWEWVKMAGVPGISWKKGWKWLEKMARNGRKWLEMAEMAEHGCT